jgi:hypothetical protein
LYSVDPGANKGFFLSFFLFLLLPPLGGRYAAQYIGKARKGVMCGDCNTKLPGVSTCHINQLKPDDCLINSSFHDRLRICLPSSSRTARRERRPCPGHMAAPDAAIVLDRGDDIAYLQLPNTYLTYYFIFYLFFRVVRAFLIEEQKIVKKVLAEKMKKTKA